MNAHTSKKLPLLVGLDHFNSRPGGLGRAFDYICQEFELDGRDFHRIEIGLQRKSRVVSPNSPLGKRICWLLIQSLDLRRTTSYMFSHFALHAFVLSMFIKVPVFSFFHGPWAEESNMSKRQKTIKIQLMNYVERRVYKRSEKIFCASESFKKILIERYRVATHKIVVVPLGVDLERFNFGGREFARESLKLSPSDLILISVRRLTNRMGLHDLIEAFSSLLDSSPNCHMYLIGRGPEKKFYEQQIRRIGLTGKVTILSDVSDDHLPLWYLAANVSVVPSSALEGFGLVVLESLACGTPVIATRCDGLREVVEKWNRKFLVNPNSPRELAIKLREFSNGELITNPQDNRDFATQFTWNKCFQVLVKEIESISITFINSESLLSGAELSLVELINSLENEVDCKVVVGEVGELSERFRQENIPVSISDSLVLKFDRHISLSKLALIFFTWLNKSFSFFMTLKKDFSKLIFINTFKSLVICSPYLFFTRRRAIFWAHDSFEVHRTVDYPKNLFYRWILKPRNVETICNSKYTQRTLKENINIESTLVLYPVFTNQVPILPKFEKGGTLIGISGRISNWKGQLFGLHAIQPLFAFFPSLKLEILGSPLFNDTKYYEEIIAYISSNCLTGRVVLTPFTSNPLEVVNRWDLSIHTSIDPEPFGRVIIDSLKVGVPALVPDSGGPLEIIRNGENGLFYKMNDVLDLRTKIQTFLCDSELRRKLTSGALLYHNEFDGKAQAIEFQKWLRANYA